MIHLHYVVKPHPKLKHQFNADLINVPLYGAKDLYCEPLTVAAMIRFIAYLLVVGTKPDIVPSLVMVYHSITTGKPVSRLDWAACTAYLQQSAAEYQDYTNIMYRMIANTRRYYYQALFSQHRYRPFIQLMEGIIHIRPYKVNPHITKEEYDVLVQTVYRNKCLVFPLDIKVGLSAAGLY